MPSFLPKGGTRLNEGGNRSPPMPFLPAWMPPNRQMDGIAPAEMPRQEARAEVRRPVCRARIVARQTVTRSAAPGISRGRSRADCRIEDSRTADWARICVRASRDGMTSCPLPSYAAGTAGRPPAPGNHREGRMTGAPWARRERDGGIATAGRPSTARRTDPRRPRARSTRTERRPAGCGRDRRGTRSASCPSANRGRANRSRTSRSCGPSTRA